ncbi:uncharacterized protein [Paramisgurnus dabryanus]|uniref:uncharacterized protein n=1 Tax=Paramisgurnus dabryanus TaxID=90735 RepID=UPI003CCFA943
MFGFLQLLKSTKLRPKRVFIQTLNITSKATKRSSGVTESVFVMGFLFVAVLGPAGWILSSSSDTNRKRQ